MAQTPSSPSAAPPAQMFPSSSKGWSLTARKALWSSSGTVCRGLFHWKTRGPAPHCLHLRRGACFYLWWVIFKLYLLPRRSRLFHASTHLASESLPFRYWGTWRCGFCRKRAGCQWAFRTSTRLGPTSPRCGRALCRAVSLGRCTQGYRKRCLMFWPVLQARSQTAASTRLFKQECFRA